MKKAFLDLMLQLGLGATDPRDRLKWWILKDYRVFFFGINISDTWFLWHLYIYLFLFFYFFGMYCMLHVASVPLTLNIWERAWDVNAAVKLKLNEANEILDWV